MRLGQRLIQDGLITPEQLDHGLRTQAEGGGRLGSNLLDLGYLEPDVLARYLGRQHGMAPALAQHFERRDPVLPTRVPVELAARWGVVPIAALAGDRPLVMVAAIDPLPAAAVAQLAAPLGCEIVTAVAAEKQVHQCLERAYGISHAALPARPAPPRSPILVTGEDVAYEIELHLAADAPRAAAAGTADDAFELDLDADISDAADEQATACSMDDRSMDAQAGGRAAAPPPQQSPSDGVPQPLGDADSSSATNPIAVAKLGRISLRRKASPARASRGAATPGPARTLEEALRAMRQATGRDRVGDLAILALRDLFGGIFDAGAILVLRGPQVVGWKGFVRQGNGRALPRITMPLDAASTIGNAFHTPQPFVGSVRDGGTQAERHLWHALGTEPPHTVAVTPVVVETQIACVLYAQTRVETARAIPIIGTQLTDLADAATAAFERLIRAARR